MKHIILALAALTLEDALEEFLKLNRIDKANLMKPQWCKGRCAELSDRFGRFLLEKKFPVKRIAGQLRKGIKSRHDLNLTRHVGILVGQDQVIDLSSSQIDDPPQLFKTMEQWKQQVPKGTISNF